MAVDYVALLKTAEITHRLAHAVRAECAIHVLHGEEARFDYPQIYACGKHKVILGEFALTGQQESFASAALLHSATYTVEFRHNNSEGELTRSFYQFFYKSSLGHRGSPFPTAVDDANNGYDSRGVVV